MVKFIAKRIGISVVTLFVIIFILFSLLEFMPGSPFNDEKIDQQQKALLYEKYGLDKPVYEKFGIYIKNILLKGDFGVSYNIDKNEPVTEILKERVPVSVRLGFQALILGTIIGIVLAIVAAINKNTWIDAVATIISVIGVSLPSYVFALGLMYYLAYKLPELLHIQIFPLTYDINAPIKSSILPTIALSMLVIATVARFMRTELVEIFETDYIALAKAKGLSENKVIFKHSVRNSLIPVITVMGPLTLGLLTGSLVVEKIFGIPGMGDLLVTAVTVNDFNVVIAVSFFYSVFFILMQLIVDILYGVIDPRIRVAKGAQI